MKKIICLSLVIILISISCTKEEQSPLEGAWRLVHEYQKSGDEILGEFPVDITGSEIKIWSGNHFIFVGRFEQDSVVSDTYGGGTFKLEDDNYEETIEFHSYPDFLGQTMKILLEIKGDTITQTFPVDNNGQVDTSEYYIEKWVRIK